MEAQHHHHHHHHACSLLPCAVAENGSTKPLVIDLHTHSTCSDGMLTPACLVEKAAARGVQVLALTDHDTMDGIPEAMDAANKLGIRLIPGVEISAIMGAWKGSGYGEPVHILGYYSACGPARGDRLEKVLQGIRDARIRRAESIVGKLGSLGKPVTWGRVVAMAGAGVAPGRVHIARALLEAGHVHTFREAFNKYLYDGGPAYEQGFALSAEDAVSLVIETGGISCLAHPWSLKDPLSLVKRLKLVGLHAIEVYRADKKPNGFEALAEAYDLLKLGGSDYHGRGDPDEVKLGKVSLPLRNVNEFFAVAQPVWMGAVKDLIRAFSEESFAIDARSSKPCLVGTKHFARCQSSIINGDMALEHSSEAGGNDVALLRLSPWLACAEETQSVRDEIDRLGLACETGVTIDGRVTFAIRRRILS